MDGREDRIDEEVREEFTQHQAGGGGREAAGGPMPSDQAAPGGSSGGGGYGASMDAADREQPLPEEASKGDPHQSRGERYDELANGGRGDDSVSFDRDRDGDEPAD
jgi:hypothetical protein